MFKVSTVLKYFTQMSWILVERGTYSILLLLHLFWYDLVIPEKFYFYWKKQYGQYLGNKAFENIWLSEFVAYFEQKNHIKKSEIVIWDPQYIFHTRYSVMIYLFDVICNDIIEEISYVVLHHVYSCSSPYM